MKIIGRLRFRTSYGQNVLEAHARGRAPRGDHGDRARREHHDREAGCGAARPRQGADPRDRGLARSHLGAARASLRGDAARRARHRSASLRGTAADRGGCARRSRPTPFPRHARARAERASSTTSSASSRSRTLAAAKPGVDKVYALQAGREIRVIVRPTDVDDDQAALLSHEIAREIEDQLEYPGQVKVTVIRESRSVHVARNHAAVQNGGRQLTRVVPRRRCPARGAGAPADPAAAKTGATAVGG